MADFFIRRPIVAIVASIVITLLGLAVLQKLSIEQYPELSPPTIRVERTYQGASAKSSSNRSRRRSSSRSTASTT
jgi:multidrug efflux pump subunit AcrB